MANKQSSMIKRILTQYRDIFVFGALGCALVLDSCAYGFSLSKMPRDALLTGNLAAQFFILGIFVLSFSVIGLLSSNTKIKAVVSSLALLICADFLSQLLVAISLR